MKMNKKEIIGFLSFMFFLAILFNPGEGKIWMAFMGVGLVLGTVWFFMK